VTAAVERREALHRRALLLEYCTVGWNVVEAVVAIGAGSSLEASLSSASAPILLLRW
jgi:hypothetical protein